MEDFGLVALQHCSSIPDGFMNEGEEWTWSTPGVPLLVLSSIVSSTWRQSRQILPLGDDGWDRCGLWWCPPSACLYLHISVFVYLREGDAYMKHERRISLHRSTARYFRPFELSSYKIKGEASSVTTLYVARKHSVSVLKGHWQLF